MGIYNLNAKMLVPPAWLSHIPSPGQHCVESPSQLLLNRAMPSLLHYPHEPLEVRDFIFVVVHDLRILIQELLEDGRLKCLESLC